MMGKIIPPTPSNCEFCGQHYSYITRGKVGGMKARICDECVITFANDIVNNQVRFNALSEFLKQQCIAEGDE